MERSRFRSGVCLSSSLVPLLLLLLIGVASTGSQSISRIGFDLSTVTDDGSEPGKIKGNVLLLDNEAQSLGVIFAFSVFIANTSPFTLQLYHVDVAGRTYRLGQEFTFTPSVQKGREDIYIESLLNRRCFVIRPGDRLGLSAINTDTPAVQSKFNATSQVLLCKLEQPSGTLNCDQTYPLSIRAAAYYIASNDSSLNSTSRGDLVDCPLGTLIPGSRDVTTITTTTAPMITGAAGVKGATGVQGATGFTGVRGVVGSTGQQGWTGEMGSNGFKGVYGITGATGSMGVKGIVGVSGATGGKGPSVIGDQGVHGIRGPPGRMGNNFTVFLNRPAPRNQAVLSDDSSDSTDAFWSSSCAIWATYLWMAIVSLIILVVVIVVIFIVSMHRSFSSSHSDDSHPVKTADSQKNIMDEDYAPSNYSDLGSVEH